MNLEVKNLFQLFEFILRQEMTKTYNDELMNGIEKNLNRLYEGPFQNDITQDRAAHFEIMDACDIIFYNISKGLEAMDELRFTIDDDQVRRRAGVRVPAEGKEKHFGGIYCGKGEGGRYLLL